MDLAALVRQFDPGKDRQAEPPRRGDAMAMDADFGDRREPSTSERDRAPEVDPIDELIRIVGEQETGPPRRAKAL